MKSRRNRLNPPSRKVVLYFAAAFFVCPASAAAQADPFLNERVGATFADEMAPPPEESLDPLNYAERIARQNEQRKNQEGSFSGPIERLLQQAGEDTTTSDHWNDFEDLSGTPADDAYNDAFEWKLREAATSPLPKGDPFGDKLDSIQEQLDTVRPSADRELEQELDMINPSWRDRSKE